MILAVYVDHKKAFDSVDRKALCNLLQLREDPAGIIDLTGQNSGTEAAVKREDNVSCFLPANKDVRQG